MFAVVMPLFGILQRWLAQWCIRALKLGDACARLFFAQLTQRAYKCIYHAAQFSSTNFRTSNDKLHFECSAETDEVAVFSFFPFSPATTARCLRTQQQRNCVVVDSHVYTTHFNKYRISRCALVCAGVRWCAKATQDDYTSNVKTMVDSLFAIS